VVEFTKTILYNEKSIFYYVNICDESYKDET